MFTKLITILSALATLAVSLLDPHRRRAAKRCKLADEREALRIERDVLQKERTEKLRSGNVADIYALNDNIVWLSTRIYYLDIRIADLDSRDK